MSAELFQLVAESNRHCDGWCDLEKANTLAALVVALKPMTVVEIGVFGGKSLIPLALALKHNGAGIAVGIDPWSPIASTQEMTEPKNLEYWGNLDHERIYQRYMANQQLFGVGQFINTMRAKSDDVEPIEADIFHCDGSHEEAASRDMQRFGTKVRVGGIVVADDLGWSTGAPARGAQWLLANGFVQLYPLGTGAVFQRIK